MSLAAALHVDLSVPNFGIQHPGVEVDEEAAARFPYDPRQLPVERRLDGAGHGW